MFRFVALPCFDLCRSNSSHLEYTLTVHVQYTVLHVSYWMFNKADNRRNTLIAKGKRAAQVGLFPREKELLRWVCFQGKKSCSGGSISKRKISCSGGSISKGKRAAQVGLFPREKELLRWVYFQEKKSCSGGSISREKELLR